MRIILVANSKGGVGKTTLAVGLAGAWAEVGLRPVIIDTNDPQHSAAAWLGSRNSGIEVVRCSESDERLGSMLLEIRKRKTHGVAIVDTPPRSVAALMAAAEVADMLLAPVTMAIGDVTPVADMLRLGCRFPADRRIVMNSTHTSRAFMREMQQVVTSLRMPICETFLGDRLAIPRSQIFRLPVTAYEPIGKAASEVRELSRELLQ